MTNTMELLDLDVAALSIRLRAREVSPVEVTQAYLERITETEPKLNAYITVTANLAHDAARRAESEIMNGEWRGPFHGVPVGLKDLCYTKGIRTTGGSRVLADFVPDYDAAIWTRLRTAGAILLGKLNLHEFAVGGTSNNPHYGAVHNPYDLTKIPGGSSGGSAAAVAAKSNLATIGTDTRGSIRHPAAMCGCVGLKPTYGRVSRYGIIPLSWSLDHVGPITRTVRDAAMMLNVLAGHDAHDATSSREPVPDFTATLGRDIKGMRIGVVRGLLDRMAQETERSFEDALKLLSSMGAAVEDVAIPSFRLGKEVTGIVSRPELLDYHLEWLLKNPRDYSDGLRTMLLAAMMIPAVNYLRAQRARAFMLAEANGALHGRDVLVTPMCATTAPEIGAELIRMRDGELVPFIDTFAPFTCPFDCTGQPAISIPTGLAPNGLPMAIQIAGRSFDEASVLRVASAFEAARGPLAAPNL
ncbi:MAG: amidase [Candidatus Binataceae bacterium]